VFPSARGTPLSRDAVERLVTKHVTTARKSCASLNGRNVTPHTLRHSAAMELLHSGVDRSVIASGSVTSRWRRRRFTCTPTCA
jgi:site-specific recombinase XerD